MVVARIPTLQQQQHQQQQQQQHQQQQQLQYKQTLQINNKQPLKATENNQQINQLTSELDQRQNQNKPNQPKTMPVQKTDLSAKKKKLEEMRERERQLSMELDKHMKRPTSATPGNNTTNKKQV